jgi:hypothetical protein
MPSESGLQEVDLELDAQAATILLVKRRDQAKLLFDFECL